MRMGSRARVNSMTSAISRARGPPDKKRRPSAPTAVQCSYDHVLQERSGPHGMMEQEKTDLLIFCARTDAEWMKRRNTTRSDKATMTTINVVTARGQATNIGTARPSCWDILETVNCTISPSNNSAP